MTRPASGDPPAPDGLCSHGAHQVIERETDPDGTVRERRRCLRCGSEHQADIPRWARRAVRRSP